MKKIAKTMVFVLSVIISTSCFAACGGGSKRGEVEIFSTYMTKVVKPEEEIKASDKLEAGFNYVCGKGEAETAQVIMFAKTDVSDYSIELSDLRTAAGDTFSADNLEAFNQKYINVITPTKGESGDYGYFPDAVLPFEKAVEYKENKIKKGNNQAVLVQATVPVNQPAGMYNGSFKLSVDGKVHNIPVSMKIYDVDVPTATSLESLYIVSRYELTGGEGDDSLAMMEKYYEKLLEYKCMGYFLPVSQADAVGYAQAVRKYYDRIANYAIPYCYKTSSSNYLLDVEGTWEYIYQILKFSAEDNKQYLDKVRNYYGVVDEPISNGTVDKCNTFCDSYNQGIIELGKKVREFAKEGGYSEETLLVLEAEAKSVETMPNMITAHYHDLIKDHVVNYCPTFDSFDTEVERDEYASVDGIDWYYGCTSPRNPYATFHIDDHNHLASTQLLGWTSNEYDVSGTLYWETVLYRGYTPHVGYDCYDVADRTELSSNGEGYLLYPGAPYGIDGPVASLRLISARDGCDDYDTLRLLETLYSDKGYDAQNALKIIYRNLYTGTKCLNDNHETLYKAKESVLNLIELAQKKNVFITETKSSLSGWSLSGVAPAGTVVTVNGKNVSLSDGSFSFDIDLEKKTNEYILACGDYKVNYSARGVKSKVFGSGVENAGIRVNPSEDIKIEVTDGKSIGYDGSVTRISFNENAEKNSFLIVGDSFEKLYNKNTKDSIFSFYNPTDTRFVCKITSQGKGYEFDVDEVYLNPGVTEIHLEDFSVLNWKTNGDLLYLCFTINSETACVYFLDAYVVNG